MADPDPDDIDTPDFIYFVPWANRMRACDRMLRSGKWIRLKIVGYGGIIEVDGLPACRKVAIEAWKFPPSPTEPDHA